MNHVSQLDNNGCLQNEAAFQPMEEALDEVTKCFLPQKEISTKFTSPYKQVAEVCDYIVMFRNKQSAIDSFASNLIN